MATGQKVLYLAGIANRHEQRFSFSYFSGKNKHVSEQGLAPPLS